MSVSVSANVAQSLTRGSAQSHVSGAARAMSGAIYLHDLSGGGVEPQSLIIAEEFRWYGADVTLVLHRLRGDLLNQVPAGLRIVDLNSSRTLMDIPGLVRFRRRERPDILLANVDMNNVAALLAKGIGFSATRVVICQHNPISLNFAACANWLYRYVGLSYRVLSPLISRTVAVSQGVALELEEIAGLASYRILTINNPVVGPDFSDRSAETVEHPWFHQPHRPVFVTAGRLVAQKDHETIIRALAIHRQRFDSRQFILGSGSLHESLAGLTEQLGLSASEDFQGFRANALPFMGQADAFLLGSRCEGFGNVIVEAMACGTPVISGRCEHGPAEILDDGGYGMLVEPRNPEALTAAMDQVTDLCERFPAEMLRQRAGEFSYAAWASRYMALFKALAPHRAWAALA